ncbi:hypothetical protein WH87_04810 [Devosia epidermidihirudinis]|uniref:Uncharacterized protein n=1 Tax=Devosia epidermidihirudinis TaxID=1293439 RepID=A0A0F5QEU3_9HYPH|nr:hypothetical protein [Devosia epidermidihirudinis]KKC39517.1 hypothetical protein WH87_04810 [Devosia epidermidihirudinis]
MSDLVSKLTNLELEAHDLLRMAQLTQDKHEEMFIGPDDRGRMIATTHDHETMEFACRNVAKRAEILLVCVAALVAEVESGRGLIVPPTAKAA